jgi:ElaB/YqjD/DUF883 family membrane-anchored ribosome-binding protein
METSTTTITPTVNAKAGLADSVHRMIDETDRFLKDAAASGDEKLDLVRGRLADQVRQLRAQLEELEDAARYKARHAARVTDRTVHEHPYSAMGIAAAAGLLIGFLAARR